MMRFVAVPLVLLLLGGCSDMFGSKQYNYQESHTDTIELSGQATLTLENTNGNIQITGSDTAASVHLEATRKVRSKSLDDAKDHIGDITITSELRADDVYIKVQHPSSAKRDYGVDFVITVPTNFNFTVQSGNGNVDLSSIFGSATLALGNGSIDLVDVESGEVAVQLGNGNASLDLALSDSCSVSVEVGNGNIALQIPTATDAAVQASVGNGNITTAELNLHNLETTARRLSGVLADGTGTITLSSGNGVISLQGK